ncbi:MAG: SMI1/KNR4 family protein [Acidobacteriota bacterium]|nr:SMI1/KNR4 family protein [Acidobacteriota bacterium]
MDYERVVSVVNSVRQVDVNCTLFGAAAHRYRFEPPIADDRLAAFEEQHGIALPEEYRGFLLRCGNGGAGPYYGLFPLGLFEGAGRGLEPWREGDGFAGVLRSPFPHAIPWNLPDAAFAPQVANMTDDQVHEWHQQHDAKYWAPELTAGSFPICHQGCAYRDLLVVTGSSRGQIWLDGRASDQGIAPELTKDGAIHTFSTWYAEWLDEACDQLGIA